MTVDLPPPTIWKPARLWTGKQVFDLLMKPNKSTAVDINLETKCRTFSRPSEKNNAGQILDNSMCQNDGWLVIYNSHLLCGVVDKAIIGDGNKKSMFYVALRDFGADVAAAFMNRLAKLAARFMGKQDHYTINMNDFYHNHVTHDVCYHF
jgi:DNA-directed RNA polymerase III subunit RPC1